MPLLCRTLALNCHYNYACKVFKNPAGKEHELSQICSIIKTMMGWNFNEVAATCRERCGGMGYLANCRFGEYIALAHSTLTAEGDNRVLMTKITKDYIFNVNKKLFAPPMPNLAVVQQIGAFLDITQLDTILDLMKFRERTLFHSLAV